LDHIMIGAAGDDRCRRWRHRRLGASAHPSEHLDPERRSGTTRYTSDELRGWWRVQHLNVVALPPIAHAGDRRGRTRVACPWRLVAQHHDVVGGPRVVERREAVRLGRRRPMPSRFPGMSVVISRHRRRLRRRDSFRMAVRQLLVRMPEQPQPPGPRPVAVVMLEPSPHPPSIVVCPRSRPSLSPGGRNFVDVAVHFFGRPASSTPSHSVESGAERPGL
jgi:hypothetical protein